MQLARPKSDEVGLGSPVRHTQLDGTCKIQHMMLRGCMLFSVLTRDEVERHADILPFSLSG